ncbi:uncharacterized protein LOC117102626 [Anneissia japonica]|uniref:uncharacterized protein LOC117102626 n=1 Tax=Anneissia japonica TaxID=1529436 RepID=UPI001425AD6F|nr:uncharacterized protein LOC117102626 [Anneissia japonica]
MSSESEKRLRKFRSSAKIIIFLYRLCKTHYLSANDKGTATRGHVDDDDQKELLFDVTYFKANRKFGAIVLILVNVLEPGSQFAKTVVYLHKGETFGELAIVNKAQRQSTIIAREGIELLCIDADNYVQIFMAGGIGTLFDPENDFVKNLKFLEGWPLHLLVGNRKKCVFSYFKRGDVLIKNSKTTDWILIVKSGSCSVMKRLKEVESEQSRRRRFSLSDANGFPDHQRYRKRMSLIYGLDKVGGKSFENFDQRKRREEFESFLKDLDTQVLYGNQKRESDDKKDNRNDSKRVSFQEGEAEKEHQTLQGRRRSSGATKAIQGTKIFKTRRSTLPMQMKKPHLERRRNKSITSNQQLADAIEEDTEEEENKEEEQTEDSEDDDPLKRFYKITGDTKVVSNNGTPVGKRKTVVDEVIDTHLDQEQTEDGVKPIWVNVQTLTKGSVFGLAELAFGLQPSFAVVSNGAECILLSKKFYLEHANSHMMTKLRTDEYPYPTDEEMQAQLEVEMKWETFRIGTLKKTMKIKNTEKLARRSSLEVGF